MTLFTQLRIPFLMLGMAFVFESVGAPQLPETGLNFNLQRTVYVEGQSQSVAMAISNASHTPYLMNVSVLFNDEGTQLPQRTKSASTPPFMVLPPLHVLSVGEEYSWVIRKTGAQVNGQPLPIDREQLFWVAFRAIPEKKASDKDVSQITITPTLYFKLLYRPKAIAHLQNATVSHLVTVQREGKTLRLKNKSPLYMSFERLDVGKTVIQWDERPITLAPFSEKTVELPPEAKGDVVWSLNDEHFFPLAEQRVAAQDIK